MEDNKINVETGRMTISPNPSKCHIHVAFRAARTLLNCPADIPLCSNQLHSIPWPCIENSVLGLWFVVHQMHTDVCTMDSRLGSATWLAAWLAATLAETLEFWHCGMTQIEYCFELIRIKRLADFAQSAAMVANENQHQRSVSLHRPEPRGRSRRRHRH
jgi:hypothetical protein